MSYCNPDELRDLIAAAQKDGVVSERLAVLVGKIAQGVYRQYRANYLDLDDAIQECLIHFLQAYTTVDTARSPQAIFIYVSQMCRNEIVAMIRKHITREKVAARYRYQCHD